MLFFYHSITLKMMGLSVFLSFLCPVFTYDNNDVPLSRNSRNDKTGPADKSTHNQYSQFKCPVKSDYDSNAQGCKKFSVKNNILGLKNCDTILSLFIRNVSIHICIKHNRLFLPNASIVYVSERTRKYPLYHEKTSKKIKSFFTGSILIFQTLFTFHGDIHLSKLRGKSIMDDNFFILECDNFKLHEVKSCYKCQAFCPHIKSDQDIFAFQKELAMRLSPAESMVYQNYYTSRNIRIRRQAHSKRKSTKDFHKLTCSIALVSDHLFFKYVGNKNVIKTSNIMLELVNKVNGIFMKNFNSGKGLNEVGFVVRQIKVYRNERSNDYKLSGTYMTSDEYLKQFSLYDFSSVCLAVGFTFRNFGTVVGTAFPAYSSFNKPGGICDKRIKINSHYASYNTVIMSFFTPDELSKEILALTLTHELGHSFGARHDETDECLPGESIGNYIMSSTVNSGDKPNNFLFSPCSMRSIMPVIIKKEKCLRSMGMPPICGNAIRELDEECDCGMARHCDATDPCCTPADDATYKPCTIRRHIGKLCTPKVSSCCNASCVYATRGFNKNCNSLNVTSHGVTYKSKGEYCPLSNPKRNTTLCHNGIDSCGSNCFSSELGHHYNLKHCCHKCKDFKDCCKQDESAICQSSSLLEILYNQMDSICCSPCIVRTKELSIFNIIMLSNHLHLNVNYIIDNIWPFITILIVILIFTMLFFVSQLHELSASDHLKALKCGRFWAIFSIVDHQKILYNKSVQKFNKISVLNWKRRRVRHSWTLSGSLPD